VFKEQDDRGHGKLGCHGSEQACLNDRLLDVLEARGNRQQDFDGVFSSSILPVPAVQERGESQENDNERISHDTGEEEPASTAREALGSPGADETNDVETNEANNAESCIDFCPGEAFQGVDDNLVSRGTSTVQDGQTTWPDKDSEITHSKPLIPNREGNWPDAIVIAEPDMKPLTAGAGMNSTSQPILSMPIPRVMKPVMKASELAISGGVHTPGY